MLHIQVSRVAKVADGKDWKLSKKAQISTKKKIRKHFF